MYSVHPIPVTSPDSVPPPGVPVPVYRDEAIRRILVDMLSLVFDIEPRALLRATRGRARQARARQTAMYLAHVAGGLNLSAVGRLFARDRTTVAHACALIEDARDDVRFDRMMTRLEQALADQLALLSLREDVDGR